MTKRKNAIRVLITRLPAVLLIIVMMLCVNASCAKKDKKQNDATGQQEQQSEQDAGILQESEEPLINVEGVDLGGHNIRIASWNNIEPDPKAPYYKIFERRKKELEEKFNCTITYVQVPASEIYEKVVTTAASADPIADLIRLRSPWVVPVLAGEGLLLPVDQYFNLEDPLWNPICTQESMYKGKPYGVNSEPPTSWACVWYNKTLMEKAGLKDPYEMVYSLTWTWEKWIEYSGAVSALSTDDQKVYGTNIPHYLAFIASNGGRAVRRVNDRDAWTLDSPEAIDAVRFLKNIMKNDFVGGDARDFAEGRLGFYFSFNWANDFKEKMTDEWGMLPYPIGPNIDDYTAYTEEVQLMCLPKEAPYPKETAIIWTELSRPYPDYDYARSIYGKYFKTIRDVETALMLQNKLSLDRYWGYDKIRFDIISSNNGRSLADAIEGTYGRMYEEWLEEVTPMANSILEEIWSKYK